ncbi:MAG: SGNH/GDSL hydrolase family protein [Planctomycetota bacterium]|jgi:lysophospholipase L1-like esterase
MLTSDAFGYLLDYLLWWVLFLSLVVHTWCFFKFFPWKRRRKLGLALGNSLIFLCMLGVAALAGESYFRFVCVETDSFGVSLPARRWFVLHTKLNSMGCRDAEWTVEKPPGVRRIAFVGDSFTYGWGIEQVEDRFSDRIGAMFDRRSPGAHEVMNVAKPGWDSESQLDPIRDLIARFGVDEIVLCYVANDIDALLPTTDGYDPLHTPDPVLFDPDRSCLIDYFYRRFYLPRLPALRGYYTSLAEGYTDESIWRRQRDRLTEIGEECQRHDVTLRVVLLPMLQTLGDAPRSRPGGEAYDFGRVLMLLKNLFEPHQVPVLDLLPAIAGHRPSYLMVNRSDAHPNALAHRLFADAIWQAFYANSEP